MHASYFYRFYKCWRQTQIFFFIIAKTFLFLFLYLFHSLVIKPFITSNSEDETVSKAVVISKFLPTYGVVLLDMLFNFNIHILGIQEWTNYTSVTGILDCWCPDYWEPDCWRSKCWTGWTIERRNWINVHDSLILFMYSWAVFMS